MRRPRLLLLITALAVAAAVAPTTSGGAQSPAPAGDLIAYTVAGDAEMQIMVVPAAGGPSAQWWSGPFTGNHSWSPDGSVLASYLLELGLDGPALGAYLVHADGTTDPIGGDEGAPTVWLGSELLVIVPTPTGHVLRLVDTAGRTVRELDTPDGSAIGPIRAAPDGSRLAVAWEASDAGDGRPGFLSLYAAPDWTGLDLPIPATRASWSPDGASLAVVAGDTVFIVDSATGATRTAATSTSAGVDLEDVRWSGDGSRLIVTTHRVTGYEVDYGLRSIPVTADALDLWTTSGDVVELVGGVGDTISVASGPADAPLAWWSYDTTFTAPGPDPGPDPEPGYWIRTGLISQDGLTPTELTAITGPAPLLTWDPTGTRLAISDAAGLSILDVAAQTVTPLVAETDHGILEAAWWAAPDGG